MKMALGWQLSWADEKLSIKGLDSRHTNLFKKLYPAYTNAYIKLTYEYEVEKYKDN